MSLTLLSVPEPCRLQPGLDTDALQHSRLRCLDREQELGYSWPKVRELIRVREKQNDRKRECGNILLKRNILVHRDENVARRGRTFHQGAVLEARPACGPNRDDLMPENLRREVEREILVKKYAHRSTVCRAPRRVP